MRVLHRLRSPASNSIRPAGHVNTPYSHKYTTIGGVGRVGAKLSCCWSRWLPLFYCGSGCLVIFRVRATVLTLANRVRINPNFLKKCLKYFFRLIMYIQQDNTILVFLSKGGHLYLANNFSISKTCIFESLYL